MACSTIDAIEVSELKQRKQPFRPSFLLCGVLVLIQTACSAHGSPKGFQLLLGIHHPAQGMESQPPCWICEDLQLVVCPGGDVGNPNLC